MTIEELQDLLEIALRGASAVEQRWIAALVKKVNAANEPAPVPAPTPEA